MITYTRIASDSSPAIALWDSLNQPVFEGIGDRINLSEVDGLLTYCDLKLRIEPGFEEGMYPVATNLRMTVDVLDANTLTPVSSFSTSFDGPSSGIDLTVRFDLGFTPTTDLLFLFSAKQPVGVPVWYMSDPLYHSIAVYQSSLSDNDGTLYYPINGELIAWTVEPSDLSLDLYSFGIPPVPEPFPLLLCLLLLVIRFRR